MEDYALDDFIIYTNWGLSYKLNYTILVSKINVYLLCFPNRKNYLIHLELKIQNFGRLFDKREQSDR